jgi:hypothetical protein
MPERKERSVPWILWPFAALWEFLAFILKMTGRLVAAVLGFVLMIAGILLTLLVISAPVGIPMIILGFLLMLRSVL